jgi:hypothetical protein
MVRQQRERSVDFARRLQAIEPAGNPSDHHDASCLVEMPPVVRREEPYSHPARL